MLLYFEGYHQGEPEHQGRINSPWMAEMDRKLLELLKLPAARLQVKRLVRARRNSSGDDGTPLQKPLLERALLLVSKTGKRIEHKHFSMFIGIKHIYLYALTSAGPRGWC